MFKGILDYVNELENTAESTSAFLRKLNGARTRVRNSIVKSEESVKSMKNEERYVAKLKPEIIKEGLKNAKIILETSVLEAIRENYEFSEPQYRNALFHAIKDNDTYIIRSSGSGFKSTIKIDINLDRTAGRLDRWATGIKAYRRELEVKIPRKNDKKKKQKTAAMNASRAWAKIFDNRGNPLSKFAVTVRRRLELSGAVAPFWQLLDKGKVSMASDRGGYPTPINRRTNFLDKAEKSTNTFISNIFKNEKQKYSQLFKDYDAYLVDARGILIRLDELADQIRLDLKIIRGLEKSMGLEIADIDRNKLEKQVQLIRRELLTGGRINVGIPGKRKTLSVETIKELLY